MERWLPVPGWPEYEVSDQGRVKSLARVVPHPNGALRLRERVLRPRLAGTKPHQRYRVGLCRGGEMVNRQVHQLVLEAFVGPCPEGMEALHGPGGPLDNRLENLRWGTHLENMADKRRDGTSYAGERLWSALLTEADVLRVRADRERSHDDWADVLGVASVTIAQARSGRTWKHLPGAW